MSAWRRSAGVDPPPQLPFSAVVGQDEAKLALILTAVDPRVGGVLLRGEKGSAKSTLARGLAALLPGGAPFVELPLGASEDRVVGTLDLTAALTGGALRFSPGLLAAADGGVLYVDEVNLLPDHLVDVLLDAAASGVNRVEREGISHVHPSRFLLIGSMNPEEGDLRPQLLDRFGLAVDLRAGTDPMVRAAAVRRRLAFDVDPATIHAAVAADEASLSERLATARAAPIPDGLVEVVTSLCAAMGAEGLRADLTICRAAGALAGWEGRPTASPADVRRVAGLALAHRARRDPLEAAGLDRQRLSDALEEHIGPPEAPFGQDGHGRWEGAGGRSPSDRTGGPPDPAPVAWPPDPTRGSPPPGPEGPQPPPVPQVSSPPGSDGAGGPAPGSYRPTTPIPAEGTRQIDAASLLPSGLLGRRAAPGPAAASAAGRDTVAESRRGRLVGDRPLDDENPRTATLAVGATVRRAAARLTASGPPPAGSPLVSREDLREAVRVARPASLIVIAVDASGSMGAPQRMEAAKGAVFGLLTDAYQHRDLVGLVAFGGDGAEVLLRPTGSVEVARARLAELPTGGRTPLATGIQVALRLATEPARAGTHRPLLVLVTDGRATAGPPGQDPVSAAERAADAVHQAGVAAVVVDVEDASGGADGLRLRLAGSLSIRMGARYVRVAAVDAEGLWRAIRDR
jgi:magnesium chelatase subunit D